MIGLDMDAFAGGLRSLSKAIEKTAQKTGIDRKQLCFALFRNASTHKRFRDAQMWKHAHTESDLGRWVYKQAGEKFGGNDELIMIKLANEIPAQVRRGLIEIAKTLGRSNGGKPKALDFSDAWRVRRLVDKLRAAPNRLSKEKVYAEVGERFGVGAHTVRRECEPKERERSRQKKMEFEVKTKTEI
jgi:hypothetical protein